MSERLQRSRSYRTESGLQVTEDYARVIDGGGAELKCALATFTVAFHAPDVRREWKRGVERLKCVAEECAFSERAADAFYDASGAPTVGRNGATERAPRRRVFRVKGTFAALDALAKLACVEAVEHGENRIPGGITAAAPMGAVERRARCNDAASVPLPTGEKDVKAIAARRAAEEKDKADKARRAAAHKALVIRMTAARKRRENV